MANNIFDTTVIRNKSFEEVDIQFAEYHTSGPNCVCNPESNDNWIVHNWIEGEDNV